MSYRQTVFRDDHMVARKKAVNQLSQIRLGFIERYGRHNG
jgi:hypothetical protein